MMVYELKRHQQDPNLDIHSSHTVRPSKPFSNHDCIYTFTTMRHRHHGIVGSFEGARCALAAHLVTQRLLWEGDGIRDKAQPVEFVNDWLHLLRQHPVLRAHLYVYTRERPDTILRTDLKQQIGHVCVQDPPAPQQGSHSFHLSRVDMRVESGSAANQPFYRAQMRVDDPRTTPQEQANAMQELQRLWQTQLPLAPGLKSMWIVAVHGPWTDVQHVVYLGYEPTTISFVRRVLPPVPKFHDPPPAPGKKNAKNSHSS